MPEKKKSSGKRKGLGGLSAEKKKKLKQLIMSKAAEEMKAQDAERKKAKDSHISKVVGEMKIDGLNDSQMEGKVKEFYARIKKLEEDKYDWEVKIRQQELEINELTIKVNDVKGKFVKPVLKKVSKTDTKLAKFAKNMHNRQSFRDQLKSTGQNQYALEEKHETEKHDWSEDLKPAEKRPAPPPKEPSPPPAAPEPEADTAGMDSEVGFELEVEE